jgi:hypothetical protein
MRVQALRISGFRAIGHGVQIEPVSGAQGRRVRLHWADEGFTVRLPVEAGPSGPMLSALLGANSAGKSTVLLALHTFFGPTVKLDPTYFYRKGSDAPVVIEVTLVGKIESPQAWHRQHCVPQGELWTLTVAGVWRGDQRRRYVQGPDGEYVRLGTHDRRELAQLLPEWRVIWADRALNQEANLERKSLMSDLVDALLAQGAQHPETVVGRMAALVAELELLVASRTPADPDDARWAPIAALEARLAQGLTAIAPQPSRVHLRLAEGLPSLRTIFAQSLLSIDDGVELDWTQHGLGMQRALVVSILRTWCDSVRDVARDYLFAIEEPEIYLHPHANRVLLNLLEEIAGADQVIYTTHAGEFVNRTPLQNLVTVYRTAQGARVIQPRLAHLAADALVKVQRYLQEDRSDMLFARAVVLVEGQAEYFALPAFARTLGLDLDRAGVSVVFVNGIGNFGVYHEILAGFAIPHVVVMDGDGQAGARRRQYDHLADVLVVLPHDFEELLVGVLSPARLLQLMNECLARRGRPPRKGVGAVTNRAAELAALGKPLVGRVAGELLAADEVARLAEVRHALDAALTLAAASPAPQAH